MTSVLQATTEFRMSFAALLHPDKDMRQQHLAWLEHCYSSWLRVSCSKGQTAELRQILWRSGFHQQLVREVFGHLVSTKFEEVSPTLKELLSGAFRGIGQSKLIEDGIKAVSEAADKTQHKKLAARETWAILVRSNVLGTFTTSPP